MRARWRRWIAQRLLLAAAMPLLQTAGCLPDLLANATSNAINAQYSGALFTSLDTVMFNLLEF
ncbi:MAG: hypothetical protein ACYSUQ_02800 [Planctomycetota bacterium]